MNVQTHELEAIASVLADYHTVATEKWSKCQWNYTLGQLKLVNLKGLTKVDYDQMVIAAKEGIPEILSGFAATEEAGYKDIVRLAGYAEVVEFAEEARTYLQLVEASALSAEELGLELLTNMREDRPLVAAQNAQHLLRLEGQVRKSGKRVWADLAYATLDFVNALAVDWVPIMRISGALYGNTADAVKARTSTFWNARRWCQNIEGQTLSPDWVRKEADWFRYGRTLADPSELERI